MGKLYLLNKNPISAGEQARMLQSFGHEVLVFNRLDPLLGAMTLDPPRLILVDKHLGDPVALDWVSRIKSEKPNQAVIVLIGNSEQRLLRSFMKEDIQDCIFKPFTSEVLYLRTHSFSKLRKREVARDLFHEFIDEDGIKYVS